jgi:hypothetical protein
MKNFENKQVYDCPVVETVRLVSDGTTMQTLSEISGSPLPDQMLDDMM